MKMRNWFIASVFGTGIIAAPLIASAQEPVPVVTVTTVPYLNGGIGEDEAATIRSKANDFSLRLTFAEGPNNEFTSNVPVVIADARGNPVFALSDAGPLLYVMLPKGSYTVIAQAHDVAETEHVTLDGAQGKDVAFHWNPPST